MNRFSVWQSVQVSNAEHPRAGQAGTVQATTPNNLEEVAVRFDIDNVLVVMNVADLKAL